jgi:tRNA (mo5U34)-methyltransferase
VPSEWALPRIPLPDNAGEFLELSVQFHDYLNRVKSLVPVPNYGWYPYNSLAILPDIADLLRDDFPEIANVLRSAVALDIGGADGDFAVLLDHFGVTTDAVDYSETNLNRLEGLRTLTRALDANVQIADLNLDGRFSLPRDEYGMAIFLGILYHLKNPFYILEELANKAAYCILSTRVAEFTHGTRLPIGAEPVAYLLNSREINDDPTNYWIFSPAGLFRLLDRSGWFVRAQVRRGPVETSDPVAPDADDRIFLLLKSRRRYANVHARPLDGWHPVEEDAWRWTAKRFAIEAVLPQGGATREFTLQFMLPDSQVLAGKEVTVTCNIAGETAGSLTCGQSGAIEFRGTFPPSVANGAAVTLEFTVEGSLQSENDPREFGILIPLLGSSQCSTTRLPLWVS